MALENLSLGRLPANNSQNEFFIDTAKSLHINYELNQIVIDIDGNQAIIQFNQEEFTKAFQTLGYGKHAPKVELCFNGSKDPVAYLDEKNFKIIIGVGAIVEKEFFAQSKFASISKSAKHISKEICLLSASQSCLLAERQKYKTLINIESALWNYFPVFIFSFLGMINIFLALWFLPSDTDITSIIGRILIVVIQLLIFIFCYKHAVNVGELLRDKFSYSHKIVVYGAKEAAYNPSWKQVVYVLD